MYVTFLTSGVIEMEEEELEKKTIFGFRETQQNNDNDTDDDY